MNGERAMATVTNVPCRTCKADARYERRKAEAARYRVMAANETNPAIRDEWLLMARRHDLRALAVRDVAMLFDATT